MNNQKIVTIFGGSGFLGTNLVAKLSNENFRIIIVSRNPNYNKIKTAGYPGQIKLEYGDIKNLSSVKKYIKKSDIVINLVGTLFSKKNNSFSEIHIKFAKNLACLCQDYNVKKFIHISALGVTEKNNISQYAKSKLDGEIRVLSMFPEATIFRPSIIFGKNDNFFNLFANISRFLPFLPMIGAGKNLIQPVYVSDVSKAIITSLHGDETNGNIYELGGPDIYSFEDLMKLTLRSINKNKKPILKIPYFLANLMAFFIEFMPQPLITRDQIKLLKVDNKVQKKSMGFSSLKITPRSIKKIVPEYLKSNY